MRPDNAEPRFVFVNVEQHFVFESFCAYVNQ